LTAGWVTALDGRYPTLAEVLRSQGYLTAGFVANTGYGGYEFGLSRGFIHYEDYTVSAGRIILSSSLGRFVTNNRSLRRAVGYHQTLGRKTAAEINEAFLSWQAQSEGRPFFAFLNYFDAHGPYVPPEPFSDKFNFSKPSEWNPLSRKEDVSPKEIQSMINGYDASIAYLDHQLGLLFAELEKRNLSENTLVIITSDHGEEFGEHGVFDHGNTLYLPSVHIPLIVLYPKRVPAGALVEEPVTLRDLPATVMDLLQLETGTRFPGRSLAPYWDGTDRPASSSASPLLSAVGHAKNVPAWIPVSKGDMQSLWMGNQRYIKNGDAQEELYDLANDAAEEHDQADSEDGRRGIERFRRHLETILSGPQSPD
jgi:arylsulfatase A-like enzyme